MAIRMSVDESIVKGIQDNMSGEPMATDITHDALTLYNWVVKEAAAGRVFLSANASGEDIHQLDLPALSNVIPKA